MAKRKTFDLNAMNEQEMRQLERKINSIYRDAAKDIRATCEAYWHGDEHTRGYDVRLKEMQARLDAGEIDKAYFELWKRNQIGRGKRWEALRDKIVQRTTQANTIAAAYVNDKTPGIYSLNANYTAYQVESHTTSGSVDFTLLPEQAVKNLTIGNNQSEFKVAERDESGRPTGEYTYRRLQVNPKVDYEWNSSRIERALTIGIMNGESIKHITDRFMEVMKNNRNAAVRNARTAVTSAQNAGQLRTMEAAQDIGIEVMKEWMCALDDRTRDSHAELDGVRVPVDADFPNGLSYPGDPKGEPSETYNCRCTLRYIMPGVNANRHRMTYGEWLESKESGGDDDGV